MELEHAGNVARLTFIRNGIFKGPPMCEQFPVLGDEGGWKGHDVLHKRDHHEEKVLAHKKVCPYQT